MCVIWNAGIGRIEVEYALHNEYYDLLTVHTWRLGDSSFNIHVHVILRFKEKQGN